MRGDLLEGFNSTLSDLLAVALSGVASLFAIGFSQSLKPLSFSLKRNVSIDLSGTHTHSRGSILAINLATAALYNCTKPVGYKDRIAPFDSLRFDPIRANPIQAQSIQCRAIKGKVHFR